MDAWEPNYEDGSWFVTSEHVFYRPSSSAGRCDTAWYIHWNTGRTEFTIENLTHKNGFEQVCGPLPTLEAAQAAWLILVAAGNNT